MSVPHPLSGIAAHFARASEIQVTIPWALATPLGGEGVRVPLAVLAKLVLEEIGVHPIEWQPSAIQLKILRALRGGRQMAAKALRAVLKRSYYGHGRGTREELMAEGLLQLKAGKYSLTEIGEAKAKELLSGDERR